MEDKISLSTEINAAVESVWKVLTSKEQMIHWMGETDMQLEVNTSWAINSPIIITGFHHLKFTNQGKILAFDEYTKISYTHLSSLSKLPDLPESYAIINFDLKPMPQEHTMLNITISDFPTDAIYHHLQFYWRGTIMKIKKYCEFNTNSIT